MMRLRNTGTNFIWSHYELVSNVYQLKIIIEVFRIRISIQLAPGFGSNKGMG
jgi:hypothetical protein